jgi:hypothetical protein
MKIFFLLILFFCSLDVFAQEIQSDTRNRTANRTTNTNASINQIRGIYDYDFVERKPIFIAGKDSLNKVYLGYFTGFDSLAVRCIDKGDTAKYIRVHFEFVIDENGTPYDGKFSYIGTTRYGSSSGDKKVKYFDDLKEYFNGAIKKMIQYIPSWRPAMQNNIRVSCFVKDSFQFWLGINPEPR